MSLRKVYKKSSLEAESCYYRELFDSETNSTKQLWRNLNQVSSFRHSKSKSRGISQLYVINKTVPKTADICNGFIKYFSTVGQKLVENLHQNNYTNHMS